MRLELNNETIYIIRDALDYYRQISEHDKQERERAYANFLDAFLEAARIEEQKYKKLNEIIESHTISENYYLDLVNKYKADGLDFFTLGGKYVDTITKEQLANKNATIPKTPYRPYKIVDGQKIYIVNIDK